jgi:hypothetical protein
MSKKQIDASLLISPTEYMLTERLYGPCVPKLAVELGVTQQIVRAYQQTLRVTA